VAAALVRDGRVLLCHRTPDREWYPDVWDLPGGHIEPSESPADALARELAEELGITVEPPAGPPFAVVEAADFDMQVWLVTEWVGEVSNAAPLEHDDLAWYAGADLGGLELADESYPALIATALGPGVNPS
jgi:8-oxo-dGTP pyrophosphatase MutT (NUDIX family)